MVPALAEVTDPESALEFARDWGLMSHGVDENELFAAEDDLEWLYRQADFVRQILDLVAIRAAGTAEELVEYLSSLPGRTVLDDREIERFPDINVGTPVESRSLPFAASTYDALASEIIFGLINAHVGNLHCALIDVKGLEPSPVLSLTSTAPIAAIYWHLAVALSDGRIRRCRRSDCTRGFIALDNRQTYCTERCAGRARKRQQRHDKRQGRNDG